jgi:hypothetical protein
MSLIQKCEEAGEWNRQLSLFLQSHYRLRKALRVPGD